MSKEKQIEEMAKILCGMKNGCDGCMFSKVNCNERNYAEEIYNAGYRKRSENTIKLYCKVGDTVYQTDGVRIYELEILDILLRKNKPYYETESIDFDEDAIGKTVFLTREEAEKLLIK